VIDRMLHVLLVEDNPFDRELTLRAFRRNPAVQSVSVAVDGAEALAQLFSADAHDRHDPALLPAVIFLDLKLPKIGGIDVLRAIRSDARTRHIPVVILTSSEEERDLQATYQSGANSYVVKPIEADAFSRTITAMGLYWTTVNRTVS
jgi:two-component system response regulator